MRAQLSLGPTTDIRFKSRVAAPVGDNAPRAVRAPAGLDSGALLRGTREVLIHHGGEVYRLRHTRNDKLILTK